MPSATRLMLAWTRDLVASLTARIVPSMWAVSGMMLSVVPAVIRPTVTTQGSNTSIVRVTIVWRACTISQATGIGSTARNGSLACPPLPMIETCSVSADAIVGPPRHVSQPVGSIDVMCRANAPVTGDGEPSARGGTSSSPSSSMKRAPCSPSSPGWNMNSTRPASSPARSASSRAAPTSIAVWVSWPQACILSSCVDENSSPVSSVSGRASMSPRNSTVGPGLPPVSRAAMPLVVSCTVTSSGSGSIAASTCSCVIGSSLPTSGKRCRVRRSSTASANAPAASSCSASMSIRSARSCCSSALMPRSYEAFPFPVCRDAQGR